MVTCTDMIYDNQLNQTYIQMSPFVRCVLKDFFKLKFRKGQAGQQMRATETGWYQQVLKDLNCSDPGHILEPFFSDETLHTHIPHLQHINIPFCFLLGVSALWVRSTKGSSGLPIKSFWQQYWPKGFFFPLTIPVHPLINITELLHRTN